MILLIKIGIILAFIGLGLLLWGLLTEGMEFENEQQDEIDELMKW